MESAQSMEAGKLGPSPEVLEKPVRRRFTLEYKARILAEADACTESGALGELLRREGLYSSHLVTWRRQRDEGALAGLTDPEEKRQAVTDTFYSKVFGRLVKESGAKFLFHGTILTDIEETVAGIKRQHNILSQLGIDTEETYGYTVVEPLKTLRKDGVREVCRYLEMPADIAERMTDTDRSPCS